MTGCRYLLLSGILIISVMQDFRQRRISSRLILIGMLSEILIRLYTDHSSAAAVFSVGADILLPVILLFPLFLIRALGAGDIKLCALISCTIGFADSLSVIYLAFFLGSIWFLISIFGRKFCSVSGRAFRREKPFAWTFLIAFFIFLFFQT